MKELLFGGKENKALRHLYFTCESLSYKLYKSGVVDNLEDLKQELFKALHLFFDEKIYIKRQDIQYGRLREERKANNIIGEFRKLDGQVMSAETINDRKKLIDKICTINVKMSRDQIIFPIYVSIK